MNYKEKIVLLLLLAFSTTLKAQTNADSIRLENELNQCEKARQESIRESIIKNKPRKDIVNSLLQELYIRDAIELTNDSIYFDLELDLHYWDCGTPDNFSHELNFAIKDNKVFRLPKTIIIKESINKPEIPLKIRNITFELISITDTNFIYHSEKYKRTLVIFKSEKNLAPTVWYFTHLTKAKIRKYGIIKLIEKSKDSEFNVPYRSYQFRINQYEQFIMN